MSLYQQLSKETLEDKLLQVSLESETETKGHPYPKTLGGWYSFTSWLRHHGFEISYGSITQPG